MKKIISIAALFSLLSFNVTAQSNTDYPRSIVITHTQDSFAGQGFCSYTFNLDSSNVDKFGDLEIKINALNEKGNKVAEGILNIDSFGGSMATKSQDGFLEIECRDDISNFEIVSAKEKIGKTYKPISLSTFTAENPKLATVSIKK